MLSSMRKVLIRWKLKEVMARYDIKGVDLAKELDVSTNTISSLRKAKTMPRLDGEQLNLLLNALNRLAKDKEEVISHVTLIDYVYELSPPTTKTSKPFAHNKRRPTQRKKSEVDEVARASIPFKGFKQRSAA